MAEISTFLFFRHLRAERSSYVLRYRKGALVAQGQGLTFWFLPLSASIAEVPVDDQELNFLFNAKSQDFQEVTAQGVVTFRVEDPEKLADRINFTIDLRSGQYLSQPFAKISLALTQLAQQFTWDYFARRPVREILSLGCESVRSRIAKGYETDSALDELGIRIVSIRVSDIAPSSKLERALETPERERIQQKADEATFERRAQAVEKERAIQEAELQNQIELATREEQLIAQRGQNDRRRVTEEAQARKIETEASVERGHIEAEAAANRLLVEANATADKTRITARSDAESIQLVEAARVEGERERMAIYRDLRTPVMIGLALQELAGKLTHIDHLNVTPEMFGPQLMNLIEAGTKRLEEPA
jgi:regulator of protease activity HflC (stomatin/prohibitin superfamily)